MNDINTPKWFWIVSGLALVWNLMGVMAYLQSVYMSAEDFAQMSQAEQQLISATPSWAKAAFATAVFGGTLGCVLLLLKNKLALPVLIISLIAILVQMYNAFFVMDSVAVFGPGSAIMPSMVILIGIGLILLSNKAIKNHWIK